MRSQQERRRHTALICGLSGEPPGPRVPEPELRQEVQLGRLRTAILDRDLASGCRRARPWRIRRIRPNSGRRRIRPYRSARIRGSHSPAARFSSARRRVGELGLRVLVEHLQVGVGGRGVKVVIAFLDVFAVVAFAVGQAEQPLLQDTDRGRSTGPARSRGRWSSLMPASPSSPQR